MKGRKRNKREKNIYIYIRSINTHTHTQILDKYTTWDKTIIQRNKMNNVQYGTEIKK